MQSLIFLTNSHILGFPQSQNILLLKIHFLLQTSVFAGSACPCNTTMKLGYQIKSVYNPEDILCQKAKEKLELGL